MPSRQSKYQHIIDRTLLRPRDIIKFSNSILDETKKRISETEDKSKLFTNSDIHKSRELYSAYFLREIDDEIHKHVPNYKKYLDIIKGIGVYRFELGQFETEYQKHKVSMPEILQSTQILKQLHEFSLVSFYRPG